MPRTSTAYRFRRFGIVRDAEPDAEPHSYALECAVCADTGLRSDDPGTAHEWIPAHLRAHPEHLTYREHVTRPYRAVPGEWR